MIHVWMSGLGWMNGTLPLSIGLLSFIYKLLFCSRNPMHLLLTEIVDGFCGFTAMIAGSYYAAAEAPPGMLASFNGILFAAILAAGRALGTSIGSKLIGLYGIRMTYLLGAYLTGFTAVIYFFINQFFLKKIREKRHQKLERGNYWLNKRIDERAMKSNHYFSFKF